jgi:hypothetical protein
MLNFNEGGLMDKQTQSDIELLLNVARPKLVEADAGGGSELFNAVGEEFGPMAHRVFLELDMPSRKLGYHNAEIARVLLDPWTIFNRARSLNNDITPDEVEFWKHGDMIKTLCDYIDLKVKEIAIA